MGIFGRPKGWYGCKHSIRMALPTKAELHWMNLDYSNHPGKYILQMSRTLGEATMGGSNIVYSFRPLRGDKPAAPSGLSGAPGATSPQFSLILCHFLQALVQTKSWAGISMGKYLYSPVQYKSCPKNKFHQVSNNPVMKLKTVFLFESQYFIIPC